MKRFPGSLLSLMLVILILGTYLFYKANESMAYAQNQSKTIRVHKTEAIAIANQRLDALQKEITFMQGITQGWMLAKDSVDIPADWRNK